MQKNSVEIAKKSLRDCYEKEGILAGRTHYASYWARDSLYASWGALNIGDLNIVKKNLENFLKYERNGQIPLRIGSSFFGQMFQMIGIKPRFGVQYKEDKGFNEAIDPNLLFLITLQKYSEKSKDFELARKNISKLGKIIKWAKKWERNGLIHSENYAHWQDSLKKKGAVLYTNVLYYQSLKLTGELLGKLNVKNRLKEKSEKLKERINEKFWSRELGYYLDYFNEKKESKVFSSDGNFFSIIFGIANKKQSESILKKAKEFGISKDVPSHPNYPRYGGLEVHPLLHLLGLKDYNDHGICWPWIGGLHSMALTKTGKKEEAEKILKSLSRYFVKEGEVYETYEITGKPLNRFFQKSEHPFAWAAGFYLLAKNELKKI
ncbi:MAG: amylo-alpha-1,6-glucosidase [archaeon]|nr:amylo-alpha-1,6-glucosidase [archaeon]